MAPPVKRKLLHASAHELLDIIVHFRVASAAMLDQLFRDQVRDCVAVQRCEPEFSVVKLACHVCLPLCCVDGSKVAWAEIKATHILA